jgi:hypothetical protein
VSTGNGSGKKTIPAKTPSATVTLAETIKSPSFLWILQTETIVGQNYLRDGNTVNKILRAFTPTP